MKKNLEQKFVPLSSKPDSVKQDLENLQREVQVQLPLLDGRNRSSPCWTGGTAAPPAGRFTHRLIRLQSALRLFFSPPAEVLWSPERSVRLGPHP